MNRATLERSHRRPGKHPDVATILAPGGNAMVKAAYSLGKPALGVGAGNVPTFIERTAHLTRAANDVVVSKSFDNWMVCASEHAVILDEPIYEPAMAEFAPLYAYRANAQEKALLEKFLFGLRADGTACGGAMLNASVVGQSPQWVARNAGFPVPEQTSIILVEVPFVGPGRPLTREKRVWCWLAARDAQHGIELAEQMVELDGLGHSAAILTGDEALLVEFGRRVKAVRIIRDSPGSMGGIGDIDNGLVTYQLEDLQPPTTALMERVREQFRARACVPLNLCLSMRRITEGGASGGSSRPLQRPTRQVSGPLL